MKEKTENLHRLKYEADQAEFEGLTFKPELNERSKQMAYLR